jgi:hypothetical protein
MMTDSLLKGLDHLVEVFDDPKYLDRVADYTAAWEAITYEYVGTITCRCQGGHWVRAGES